MSYQNERCLYCLHPPLSYEGRREEGRQLSLWWKTLNLIGHYGNCLSWKIQNYFCEVWQPLKKYSYSNHYIIQMGIAVNGSHSKFLTRCRVITDIRQKMEISECLAEKFNSDSMQLPQNSQCSFCQWISFPSLISFFWYSFVAMEH